MSNIYLRIYHVFYASRGRQTEGLLTILYTDMWLIVKGSDDGL
jgi:hypothetical protein